MARVLRCPARGDPPPRRHDREVRRRRGARRLRDPSRPRGRRACAAVRAGCEIHEAVRALDDYLAHDRHEPIQRSGGHRDGRGARRRPVVGRTVRHGRCRQPRGASAAGRSGGRDPRRAGRVPPRAGCRDGGRHTAHRREGVRRAAASPSGPPRPPWSARARPARRHTDGRPGTRAGHPARSLPTHALRPRVSAVHDPRSGRCRQVAPRGGVPPVDRRPGDRAAGPVPVVRRGHRPAAGGRDAGAGCRSAARPDTGGGEAERRGPARGGRARRLDRGARDTRDRARRRSRRTRGDAVGDPRPPRAARRPQASRRGVRRRPMGEAHAPRAARPHRRLVAGRSHHADLPRPPRVARATAHVGRGS